MERREKEDYSLYGGYRLFLSKNGLEVVGLEVVRVDCSVASILFFRIDILLSNESVWFGAKITRMEPDDKVELRKVLGPLCLPLGQHLGSKKILKVFMIYNNVNEIGQTFQVVLLNFENFKDSKQFLVIYVII